MGQPELSSVVVLLPVASATPGQVDLLLVTRDIWSLRFNTTFEYQANALTLLQTSLSENNLFGWRKYLSFGFSFDQGKYYYGPTYFDPNIRGTRLTLYAARVFYNSRATGEYEGNSQIASLRYPLYSLASRWGAASTSRTRTPSRASSAATTSGWSTWPGRPTSRRFPYEYRRRVVIVDAKRGASFGTAVIQRVSAGYLVDRRRSEVLPTFPGDAATAQLFLSQWAPIHEQRSEPYLRYEVFTPRYVVLRDLDTFDLREKPPARPAAARADLRRAARAGRQLRRAGPRRERGLRSRAGGRLCVPHGRGVGPVAVRPGALDRSAGQRRRLCGDADRGRAVPDRGRGAGRVEAGGHDQHAVRPRWRERALRGLRDRRIHRHDDARRPHRGPDAPDRHLSQRVGALVVLRRRRCGAVVLRSGSCATTSAWVCGGWPRSSTRRSSGSTGRFPSRTAWSHGRHAGRVLARLLQVF
jgi:hypothetical protein